VLWPQIKTVNAELKRYTAKRDMVEYFETQAFFKNHTASEEELQIDEATMNEDKLHPSAEGYRRWGADVVAALDSLIQSAPDTD